VLEKPRHRELIDDIIRAGARVALYPAGDVAGALLAAIPGRASTPDGNRRHAGRHHVGLCRARGLGGEFLARIDPQLHTEAKAVREAGLTPRAGTPATSS
jgi:fructose-1,6-bisphosphatase II